MTDGKVGSEKTPDVDKFPPQTNTLPETNIAPENRPLEVWRFLLETTIFRGKLLVLGSVNSDNTLDMAPTLDSSGKWRLIGIPDPKHVIILVVTVAGSGSY